MGGFEMSRENDIKNAAWDYFQDLDSHHFHLLPHCNPQTDAFESCAKWADKTMIDKACKWLKMSIEDYDVYDAWRGDYIDIDAIIEDFKKHLEE